MEEKKEPTPWLLLELSILLEARAFQRYCNEHPEEVQAARNLLFFQENS